MPKESELKIAQEIAINAHHGQFRKDGSPYHQHLEEVASKFEDINAKVVAWLHDVLEDTEITSDDLAAKGISSKNIELIVLLTKKREQRYEEYLDQISKNELAKKIKIADIIANLSDNPGNKQIVKFSKALIRLCANDS